VCTSEAHDRPPPAHKTNPATQTAPAGCLQFTTGQPGATLPASTRAKLDAMGLIEFFGLEECLGMLSRKLAILTSRL
jgi:hypothetical protein